MTRSALELTVVSAPHCCLNFIHITTIEHTSGACFGSLSLLTSYPLHDAVGFQFAQRDDHALILRVIGFVI